MTDLAFCGRCIPPLPNPKAWTARHEPYILNSTGVPMHRASFNSETTTLNPPFSTQGREPPFPNLSP